MKFLVYPLFFIISTSLVGMHIVTKKIGTKKNVLFHARTVISKSDELDAIRQKLGNNSPQDVVDISQGKIIIKEEIPLGQRYGICHNYVFTKLMEIVGKAPKMLNITGQKDYYAENYLNTRKLFDLRAPGALQQPGDLALYVSQDKQGLLKEITHAGIVVGNDCIESKWGPIRAVFWHPIWYVPVCFGDNVYYFKPKITGHKLLAAVQKRLKQKAVKEKYDAIGDKAQQALFKLINDFEKEPCQDNLCKIYDALECHMNIQINLPDQNGLTPRMHAERIDSDKLKYLFEVYAQFDE